MHERCLIRMKSTSMAFRLLLRDITFHERPSGPIVRVTWITSLSEIAGSVESVEGALFLYWYRFPSNPTFFNALGD